VMNRLPSFHHSDDDSLNGNRSIFFLALGVMRRIELSHHHRNSIFSQIAYQFGVCRERVSDVDLVSRWSFLEHLVLSTWQGMHERL
jgi:hypothetical protein